MSTAAQYHNIMTLNNKDLNIKLTLASVTGCGKTPMSLQLPLGVVAGLLLEELVQTGICLVAACCLSGLFLIGEVRLIELGSGAQL